MVRPITIVLSGAGGVGKGAIVRRLVEDDPKLWLSRSWTSRARRPDDAADAYVFVTREAFERHRDGGGFIEWNEFFGNLYGTPVPHAPLGSDVLLEIDVNGGRQVHKRNPDALLIFVDAPSIDAQRTRLLGRGERPERADERIAEGIKERHEAQRLGYHFVINDALDEAVDEVRNLIAAHRRRQESPAQT